MGALYAGGVVAAVAACDGRNCLSGRCQPRGPASRSPRAPSMYPEDVPVKPGTAFCAAASLAAGGLCCPPGDGFRSGFEAALFSAERGIRDTDISVVVVLCTAGKSSSADRHQPQMGLPLEPIELSALLPVPQGMVTPALSDRRSALRAAPRDVTLARSVPHIGRQHICRGQPFLLLFSFPHAPGFAGGQFQLCQSNAHQ